MNSRGFTLIELLVTVAIIGIIAAISVTQFEEYREKARLAVAMEEIMKIATAAETLYMENGEYPGPSYGNCHSNQFTTYYQGLLPNFLDPWDETYLVEGCTASDCEVIPNESGDWGTSVCSRGPNRTWSNPWNQAPVSGVDDMCYFFNNRVQSWNY